MKELVRISHSGPNSFQKSNSIKLNIKTNTLSYLTTHWRRLLSTWVWTIPCFIEKTYGVSGCAWNNYKVKDMFRLFSFRYRGRCPNHTVGSNDITNCRSWTTIDIHAIVIKSKHCNFFLSISSTNNLLKNCRN